MENTFIPKGMELVRAAVEADNADKLEEALSLYKQGLSYFITGLKYVKNDRQKVSIREKMAEYLARAEELKKAIDQKNDTNNTKKAVLSGGGSQDSSSSSSSSSDKDGVGKGAGKDKDGKDIDPEIAKLEASISGAIVREKPNVKWEDVAGLEQAKSLLKEAVILPVKYPELFTGKRTPWKGILLYGPPGTGKSFLAKAVATEAGASCFLSVSSSDLVSKYQGESERLVKTLFELARKMAPSIIFIDEVDSLCGARGDGENESSRRIKTEFLVQMQGVGKQDTGILVLGATNTPWDLDSAIRRRFEKRVYIPLPETPARFTLFKSNIGSTPHSLSDSEFQHLAQRTDGFSGADVSVMVRDALYEPVRICQMSTHFKKVTVTGSNGAPSTVYTPCSPADNGAVEMSLYDIPAGQLLPVPVSARHFESALANARASVGPEDLKRFEDWTKQFGMEG